MANANVTPFPPSGSDLNLTPHRGSTSVWDRQGWNGEQERLALTRVLVGVAGGALALQGMRQRSWSAPFLTVLGGGLAWWAMSGRNVEETRRWVEDMLERRGWKPADIVGESSAESFPASDAPGWTPTTGTGLRRGGHD